MLKETMKEFTVGLFHIAFYALIIVGIVVLFKHCTWFNW